MEKPTGVIQKIIESLQQINALDVYSPIEKDIILHNLRAAYMIFINMKSDELCAENRIEKLFVEVEEKSRKAEEQKVEFEEEKLIIEEEISPSNVEGVSEGRGNLDIEDEPIVEEEISPSNVEVVPEGQSSLDIEEEPIVEEEISPSNVEEVPEGRGSLDIEEEPIIEEKTSVVEILHDDILEFIPDAKPQPALLFDEMVIPKPEKKSLNDLLTEKKDDNSLGARFQQSGIPDLTKAIAINEKFTFIRELFRNSGVDFSNAIQKLNECENLESAFVLMEELKHQYVWDTTSTSYLTLCDLVRRRFI